MTDGTTKEANASDDSTKIETSEKEQTQEQTPVMPSVSDAQYKELQAEFTRRNQELIETKIELAKRDAKSIIDIKDTKLQNKVIQEVYGLNNLKELQLIHWERFYEIKEEDEDEVAKLRKKVTLLEYNSEVGKVEQGIKSFKRLNPELFKSNPTAEDDLRAKLQVLSVSIPIDERLDMAAKLAFWQAFVNPVNEAYRELQNANPPQWSWGAEKKEVKKSWDSKKIEDLREFFGIKKVS